MFIKSLEDNFLKYRLVDIFLKIFDFWLNFLKLVKMSPTFNDQITCTSKYWISQQKLSIKFNSFLQSVTSRLFGRVFYRFGCPNSGTHKTLVKYSLFIGSHKKCVEVAINDYTMHLIILKWFARKKMKTEEKTIGQKMSKWKKKFSTKAFSFI